MSRPRSSTDTRLFIFQISSRMAVGLPSLRYAWRRASWRDRPRARLSSISWARWTSSSGRRSSSHGRRRKNRRRLMRQPLSGLVGDLAGAGQDATDGVDHGAPAVGLEVELFAAGRGQLVEARLAVILADAPVGGDPAAIFEAVQGRVERTLLDLENVVGGVLDDVRDGMAVGRAHDQGLQYEHVERAEQQLLLFIGTNQRDLPKNIYGKERSTRRRSMGRGDRKKVFV